MNENNQNATKQIWNALLLSVAVAVLLCLTQITGNRYLVYGSLACFMLLVVWSSVKNIIVPVLMFFLPWSPILRYSPGSISFFTLAMMAACMLSFAMDGFKLEKSLLASTVLIVVITLFSKVSNGYSVEKSYIMFIILLAFFPVLTKRSSKECDFYTFTVFLGMGMVTSALISQWALDYYNIARFITVDSYFDIVRYSGFYGDPNFYAAQFTVVISGIALLITRTEKRSRAIFLLVLEIFLLYCGFLSASKTYLLVVVTVLVIWVIRTMFLKGKMSVKVAMLFGIFVIVLFVLSSSLFTNQINMIFSRVDLGSDDISGITTGRSDLWLMYLKNIFGDLKLLLFGVGYTNVKIQGRGSHSTIIQMIYQFGLIGSVFLVAWLVFMYKHYVGIYLHKKTDFLGLMILLVGAFGMWLSIDQLFFDEFFLVPFYVCMGITWLNKESAEETQELLQ